MKEEKMCLREVSLDEMRFRRVWVRRVDWWVWRGWERRERRWVRPGGGGLLIIGS